MTGESEPAGAGRRALRRDAEHGVVAGVCAGLARHLGVEPLVVRAVFVVATLLGGTGVAAYALAWALVPSEGARAGSRRAEVEVALGAGLLLLSALLAFRAFGIWLSDAVVWPLVLLGAGGALLWRQSLAPAERPSAPARGPRRPATAGSVLAPARDALAGASRTGLGVGLVLAAGFVFLEATGALGAARDVALAALAVLVVLVVIAGPWLVRLARSLAAERGERIRSQERAELAAHLHDSVLQTLALVQRRADDPREVAALARRQERELRAWLSGRAARGARPERLGAALEAAAEDVERAHGVPIEVVIVGDCPLDPPVEAAVAAAREAMTNAAKFAAGAAVDVYAEAADGRVELFVRDRGPGFDPAAIPPDRRGVRESIVGRMRRHGGRATVRSTPGEGTEVEIAVERGTA
jgi:signal transduction histidine kinase